MSSRTKYITSQKVGRNPELAPYLVRLMMAVNDLALADESIVLWRSEDSETRKVRREEAAKYFIELMIAHLYEGLQVIKEISKSTALMKHVDSSEKRSREEFERLAAYVDSDQYEKLIGRVRNNLAFHYDAKLCMRALQRVTERIPDEPLAISMGSKSADWFFEPAAHVGEEIALRDIFKVEKEEERDAITGRIMDEVQKVSDDFTRFAGHFVWEKLS